MVSPVQFHQGVIPGPVWRLVVYRDPVFWNFLAKVATPVILQLLVAHSIIYGPFIRLHFAGGGGHPNQQNLLLNSVSLSIVHESRALRPTTATATTYYEKAERSAATKRSAKKLDSFDVRLGTSFLVWTYTYSSWKCPGIMPGPYRVT